MTVVTIVKAVLRCSVVGLAIWYIADELYDMKLVPTRWEAVLATATGFAALFALQDAG